MPRSKKGRISGGARKEINGKRSGDVVATAYSVVRDYEDDVRESRERGLPTPPVPTNYEGQVFARITKIVGSGHVKATIDSKRGPKEILVRIPNLLGRRGATPLNLSSVVSVYVGTEFDGSEAIKASDHFDITSILEQKQAYDLQKCGLIPSWMVQDVDKATAGAKEETGFEFDYSEKKGDEEDEESSASDDAPGFSRKAAREDVDKDIDIDDI